MLQNLFRTRLRERLGQPLYEAAVRQALQMIGIDDAGLTSSDRKILSTLIDNFNGGPVGLKTLAAATGEEESTLEEVIEPYLIQSGFIEKTPRGRVVTERAREHMEK